MKDESKSTNTCRVCLHNDEQDFEKSLPLFEEYNDCSIAEKINCIADVGIQKGDGLPDRICPDCLLQLENAMAFKQKCEASNNILLSCGLDQLTRNVLLQVSVKKEISYNAVKTLDSDDIKVNDDTATAGWDDANIDVCGVEYFHKPKSIQVICHDCSGTFSSKFKLRVHWRKIHQPKSLVCPKCKRMFKTYKAFNTHIKIKPQSCVAASKACIEGQGKFRIFHCPDCVYKTKRVKDIDVHIAIHTGERRYQCDKCPQVFIQQTSFYDHKEVHHKEFSIETTCQYCGKLIKGRRHLYRHLKLHTDTKVSCEVCKKLFKNSKSLMQHMKRHSGVKAYSCEMCTEAFYTSSDLNCHKTKVHLKKKFKCDICGYSMNTITALKLHKPKHTTTNAVCLTCGTFVENADKLLLHQKRHIERNYPCPLCEKRFYSSKSCTKHARKNHATSMLEITKKLNGKSDNQESVQNKGPTQDHNEETTMLSFNPDNEN